MPQACAWLSSPRKFLPRAGELEPAKRFHHADEIKHVIVKWSQVNNRHRDPRDNGLFDDQF